MKFRLDYVSNSSSSSFMIVGHAFDEEELQEAYKHNGKGEDMYDSLCVEDDAKGFGLKAIAGEDGADYAFCIGLEWDDMKENETKAKFKKRIQDNLKKFLGKEYPISCIVDSGYC